MIQENLNIYLKDATMNDKREILKGGDLVVIKDQLKRDEGQLKRHKTHLAVHSLSLAVLKVYPPWQISCQCWCSHLHYINAEL